MKNLIETDEFIRAAKLNRFGGKSAAKVLMNLLKIGRVNKIYAEYSYLKGIEFIDMLIRELKISYEVSEDEFNRIPQVIPCLFY